MATMAAAVRLHPGIAAAEAAAARRLADGELRQPPLFLEALDTGQLGANQGAVHRAVLDPDVAGLVRIGRGRRRGR